MSLKGILLSIKSRQGFYFLVCVFIYYFVLTISPTTLLNGLLINTWTVRVPYLVVAVGPDLVHVP